MFLRLNKDTSNSEIEAVQHIYRQLRGADAPDDETARGIIDKLFFKDMYSGFIFLLIFKFSSARVFAFNIPAGGGLLFVFRLGEPVD